MTILKVGDTINLCASIVDFCGASQFLLNKDINISVSPNLCNINIAVPNGCLSLSGRTLEFQWTNAFTTTEKHTCSDTTKVKTLGTASTNSNGVASLQYTITQNDYDLYTANSTTFDLRVCIKDININSSNISHTRKEYQADSIQILQAEYDTVFDLFLKPNSWYTPQSAATAVGLQTVNIAARLADIFTDYQYKGIETFAQEGFVVIRTKWQSTSTTMSIRPQLTQVGAAAIIISVAIVCISIGLIVSYSINEVKTLFQGKDILEVAKDIQAKTKIECENNYPNRATDATQAQNYLLCIKSVIQATGDTTTDYFNDTAYKDAAALTNINIDKLITCLKDGTCTPQQSIDSSNKDFANLDNKYQNKIDEMQGTFDMLKNGLIVAGIVSLGLLVIVIMPKEKE